MSLIISQTKFVILTILNHLNLDYYYSMTHSKKDSCDILIVEDDNEIRYYLKLLLEQEGFPCLEAPNGKVALDLLSNLPQDSLPKLAFVDVMMPVLNGPGFIQGLNDRGLAPGLRVHFVSAAFNQPKISLHGRDCGFIPKPFSTNVILNIARQELMAPPFSDNQSQL